MIEAIGKYNTAKIFTDTIDETAYAQVLELCNQKAFEGVQIRIMPDTHAGKGCVIGYTAELAGRVVPNLIGVDIGCGMEVTYLGTMDINFEELDHFIRHQVPHGHSIHQKVAHPIHKPVLEQKIENIASKTGTVYEKHLRSVGSLGGGNHFIEINEDSGRQQNLGNPFRKPQSWTSGGQISSEKSRALLYRPHQGPDTSAKRGDRSTQKIRQSRGDPCRY